MKESILEDFEEFLLVNMRLARGTAQHTREDIARFLRTCNGVVCQKTVADYLKSYLTKAPKTYNSQITALRRFVRDYLGKPSPIASFKMAPVDEVPKTKAPTRTQVKKGFEGQKDAKSKALYLFIATTGLRKSEVLGLTKNKIKTKLRAVIPEHFTRKKRSGVTFYNQEAEEWLERYYEEANVAQNPRVFAISDREWRKIWDNASRSAGVRITSKRLRVWFSTEMGELMVPDRYVDVFQGRAPRSLLAKHYRGKGLERLKRIYDKAGLKALN